MTTTLTRKHGCPKCPLSAFCLTQQVHDESTRIRKSSKPVGTAVCNYCNMKLLFLSDEDVYVWMEAALAARIPMSCTYPRTYIRPTCPDCGASGPVAWAGPVIRGHT